MRLKQIKLSGFKSFCESTLVPFPGQMTAVVGPNGCGKSNIIDAVRWVLGESSAKNLRGDSITDVIFNGSSERKSISQASIELIFDNSLGRIAGEFANYIEISVKRTVIKDGTSFYAINNTKCRKKDVTELFLGTGLGPRSYAIIEQGMITRLIESKPQELRLFLEEAAGISKYKERRRETEIRIKHTRENLTRLDDVMSELAVQVEKLQAQAQTANQYKKLKAESRKTQTELHLIDWRVLSEKTQSLETKIKQKSLEIEQHNHEQKNIESQLIHLNCKQASVKETLETQQKSAYVAVQIIHKIEQNILQSTTQINQLTTQIESLKAERIAFISKLEKAQQEQQNLDEKIEEQAPNVDQLVEELAQSTAKLDDIEIEFESLDQSTEQITQAFYQLENQVKSNQVKQESCQWQIEQANQLIQKHQQTQQQLEQQNQSGYIQQISEESSQAQARCETLQEQLASTQDQLQTHYHTRSTLEAQRNRFNADLQNCDARVSSFQVLIQHHQTEHDTALLDWLKQKNITYYTQLFEHVQVDSGWEIAVASALKHWQTAILIESDVNISKAFENELPALETNILLLVKSEAIRGKVGRLGEKVIAPQVVINFLNTISIEGEHVSTVDTLNQAAQLSESPQPLESVNSNIDQQGYWRSTHWHSITANKIDNQFLLKQKLLQDQSLSDLLSEQLSESQTQLSQLTQVIQGLESNLQQLQAQALAAERQANALDNQIIAENKAQAIRDQNLVETAKALETHTLNQLQQSEILVQLENEIEQQNENLITLNTQKQSYISQKKELQVQQSQLKNSVKDKQDTLYQIRLKREQAKHQAQTNQQKIQHTTEQITQLDNKQNKLDQQVAELQAPKASHHESLSLELDNKAKLETKITSTTTQLTALETKISASNQAIQTGLHHLEKLQTILNQYQIEQAELTVKINTLVDTLGMNAIEIESHALNLPENISRKSWQLNYQKLEAEISRLGAINLAAIDEYETQRQRKEYLESQHTDLINALNTLEAAIHKIDKETKAKFKYTFDQVNSDLKQLFPKVFGGGSAWLALTDSDMLEAGVTIMAQPPGKKNSTIHLLSGGEKALTALSLVFAIFRLNPAPFCMLDEVDAPLDDANVVRFCKLVKEMSETVQFIYISHNKIAMEMATDLIGVTMQEAGVSRMVAVNIEKAIELAEQ